MISDTVMKAYTLLTSLVREEDTLLASLNREEEHPTDTPLIGEEDFLAVWFFPPIKEGRVVLHETQ